MIKRFFAVVSLLCLVGMGTPFQARAQLDSCTYIVMDAEGACSAINGEGTAVCTSCRRGERCAASIECMSTTSSCVLRMLARTQSLQCGDCPLGANPLPPGFLCHESGIEPTETPDDGDDTPTPTATTDEGLETPTPTATDDGSGGTPTPTDDGSGGTPTPTGDGSGGTPTPTDDGSGGTPTPTDDGSGGTPTRTNGGSGGTPTPTNGGSGGTPTRTTSATTPSGGTATPTQTSVPTSGVSTATATAGTPAATRTATSGSGGNDGEGDDGCQAVAPSHSFTGWMLLIPVLGLMVWRRRQTRL
jgi:hypothetical protein